MQQKTYIQKIILSTFIASMFFVFVVSKSFAQIGYIDTSAENKVKICKDVTCTNPTPGIIDFEISGGFPLVIDSEKGISGKAWGGELGWITFNPTNGGVFFADSTTGLLKGTALSENFGIINFSVTGQKVFIDPNTGEWSGWAWASGQYGGWVKFDCKNASCVKTTWHKQSSSTPDNIAVVSPTTPVVEEGIGERFLLLFKRVEEVTSNTYISFSSYLKSFISYILKR
jgi:hypothetical protein